MSITSLTSSPMTLLSFCSNPTGSFIVPQIVQATGHLYCCFLCLELPSSGYLQGTFSLLAFFSSCSSIILSLRSTLTANFKIALPYIYCFSLECMLSERRFRCLFLFIAVTSVPRRLPGNKKCSMNTVDPQNSWILNLHIILLAKMYL